MPTRTLVFLMLLMTTACSHVETVRGVDSVTLRQLSENPASLAEKIKGDRMIIHVEKGEALPVHLVVDLPFATLQSGENNLIAKEDVYLLVSRDGFHISRDGTHFTPVHDNKGLKEIYGFEKGALSVGFGAGRTSPPGVIVGVSTR